ncbi:hypothetical protein ABT253_001596 [Campylobacter coli]|nr:hypothetical protein [Campylobacter coli]ELD6851398.1 hypothetical protein [Campylobacter coli]ELS6265910.1 hypothetical protein [Campylobacter coli]
MVQAYPYILIIHLSCAIFFIGYLFVDIFILNIIKRKNPLTRFIHPFVFMLCIFIVVLAKLMNYYFL